MKDSDESKPRGQVSSQGAGDDDTQTMTRAEEQGEAAEADAPTAEEENPGMNTVLDADPLFGVQDDASDK